MQISRQCAARCYDKIYYLLLICLKAIKTCLIFRSIVSVLNALV